MSRHKGLTERTGVRVYADPTALGSGSNENANGLIRGIYPGNGPVGA